MGPGGPGTDLALRGGMVLRVLIVIGLLSVVSAPPQLHGVWMETLPAVRSDPPAGARRYWREVTACTQVRPRRGRGFESIQWHRVSGRQFQRPDTGRQVIGLWLRPGNAVVLAGDWWDDERLIKHELMHVLLQSGSHESRHYTVARGEACGLFPA